MQHSQSHIASQTGVRPARLALSALALLLCATPAARAQQAERPCRLVLDETMTSPRIDGTATHAEIQLGQKMTQPGGGFVIMGQGTATIIYGRPGTTDLGDGCKVVKNREFTYSLQVFVSSEDGRNGDIDMVPGQLSYPVEFTCTGQNGRAKTNIVLAAPPTITMPMVHGATKTYSEVDRGITTAGTVSLHYCRPEPQ